MAAAAVAWTASAQSVDFKGVPLGATEDEARQAMVTIAHTWQCGDEPLPGRRGCIFTGHTYAGVQALPSYAYFDEGKLSVVIVNLPTDGFDEAMLALTAKYSKPKTVRRSKVQNRMGATFDQVVALWAPTPDAIITAKRYGATVDASAVVIATKQGLAAPSADVARKREKGDI